MTSIAAILLQTGERPIDWVSLGLVLAIVGGFLLANAILFRHPRTLVEEHFGGRRRHVRTIREYIFHRVQVHLGFLFLLLGFSIELYGRYHEPVVPVGARGFPIREVGTILLAVVVLEVLGWWLSQWLFRRYVREHFLLHPPNLETDVRLARELGELFGIPSSGDDTVQSYLAKLRRRIGLPDPDRLGGSPRSGIDLFDADEGEPEEQLV